jgi:NitT/TauT family transport system permease protein
LPRQLWQSASVLVTGFGLAIVSGLAVGTAMGMFRAVRRILDPYVSAFYAMPTVALIPLVIIWLGLGFEAKVFLTWLVAVFPVIINAEIGVASVPPAFIETARAFGCSRWQVFRRVILHATVPFFIAGVRLGLGRALVGVVVAEMFTALTGLGYMIVLYGNTFRTAELFVPILVLAVISIAITNLIQRLERRIAPWRIVRE